MGVARKNAAGFRSTASRNSRSNAIIISIKVKRLHTRGEWILREGTTTVSVVITEPRPFRF